MKRTFYSKYGIQLVQNKGVNFIQKSFMNDALYNDWQKEAAKEFVTGDPWDFFYRTFQNVVTPKHAKEWTLRWTDRIKEWAQRSKFNLSQSKIIKTLHDFLTENKTEFAKNGTKLRGNYKSTTSKSRHR